jgi:hypothetical protein
MLGRECNCECVRVHIVYYGNSESTLIKKKIKFSSYIRKFRVEQLQSHTYMRKGFLIYEEMLKYFPIYEEAVRVSHICKTLQLLLSEFPYIRDKFDFLFYQCILQPATLENRKNTDDLVCSPVANKYIYTALYKFPAFYRVSNLDNMIPIAGILQTWPNHRTPISQSHPARNGYGV